jgi:Cdc6-like AAA superfamily ATPase
LRRIETSQSMLVDGMRTLSTKVDTQMSREEVQKVFSWLCPQPATGARVSLENALTRRLSGTGEWFLESKTFKYWRASKHSAEASSIWITGLPGSGKTLLCASIIQQLFYLKEKDTENMVVLYFFCDHRDLRSGPMTTSS